jgi:hypothetical protein
MIVKREKTRKTDFGILDYYKYYRGLGGKCNKALYSNVIKDINQRVMSEMTSGYSLKIPERLGIISVFKRMPKTKFSNGKLVTGRSVDYRATKEMWEEYPETKKQGKVVRFLNKHSEGYTYRICWSRSMAYFTNKSVYTLVINRDVKRGLAKKIFLGEMSDGTHVRKRKDYPNLKI